MTTSLLAWADGPVVRADDPIPNRYIVVLVDAAPDADGQVAPSGPRVDGLASTLAQRHGGRVHRSFKSALQGFVIEATADEAAYLAMDESVAFVEEDGRVSLAGTQSAPPSWGLDRVDQHATPFDGVYTYNNLGAGVDVYVIDSGIRSTHVDFGGRVDTSKAFTTIDDGRGTDDCNGHGTIVAGIIGGENHGVAKSVTLHPVRVVGCDGFATLSDVVAGVDWVTTQHPAPAPRKKGTPPPPPLPPAVANFSLSTPGSLALDTAIHNSINAGVVYVVAAGNNTGDACNYSPGRLSDAITVGASNDADNVWVSSNGGSCVDLFAPGVAITSTFILSDTSTVSMTGTSAAAPHVAGTAALYLAANPTSTPATVEGAIRNAATTDALAVLPPSTANRLLYSAFAGLDAPPVAGFTYSCRSRRCSFNGSPSTDDRGIAGFAWSFGDGASGSGATITHSFPSSPASFSVTLTVTDTAGQSSSALKALQF
ncbi:MAG: S8 family serine peptidase [Acidobacteria bacterium]|nr:S8 family serine peptidase [Acidobacteriota bacterium]